MAQVNPRFGRFDEFPLGWREITPQRFAELFVANLVSRTEFKSMKRNENDEPLNGRLIFFPNLSGIATTSKENYNPDTGKSTFETKFWMFG